MVSGRLGLLPVRPPPVRPPPVRPLTRSAPYPFGPLIYNYITTSTTTLNRETQLQVAENYLSEQPAHLLLGLHCENRQE